MTKTAATAEELGDQRLRYEAIADELTETAAWRRTVINPSPNFAHATEKFAEIAERIRQAGT